MHFVIEHLEPDVFEWCVLEYRHISSLVGKSNLTFTNVHHGAGKIASLGDVHHERVAALALDPKRTCVLDPEAKEELSPSDRLRFDTFVFGGILGDDPPRARTKDELTITLPGASSRNLGKDQMSTDTAVNVTKRILEGMPLGKMRFVSPLHLHIKKGEEVILPYKYLLDEDGKPLLAPGLDEKLRTQDEF